MCMRNKPLPDLVVPSLAGHPHSRRRCPDAYRPVTGLIGLAGLRADLSEKMALAFFGIRGVGSFYYLAYALNHVELAGGERLWAIVGLVALFSILLHGLTVTPAMRLLDKLQGRDPDADLPPPGLKGPAADTERA